MSIKFSEHLASQFRDRVEQSIQMYVFVGFVGSGVLGWRWAALAGIWEIYLKFSQCFKWVDYSWFYCLNYGDNTILDVLWMNCCLWLILRRHMNHSISVRLADADFPPSFRPIHLIHDNLSCVFARFSFCEFERCGCFRCFRIQNIIEIIVVAGIGGLRDIHQPIGHRQVPLIFILW